MLPLILLKIHLNTRSVEMSRIEKMDLNVKQATV
jgi:hypothetical protein